MPLTAAQVFTAAALKKARGQQEGSGKAGGGGSKGGQQGSWHSSAKVEQLLELLRAMQHRGATGSALLSFVLPCFSSCYTIHLKVQCIRHVLQLWTQIAQLK